jgi:DNA-directed RNA polymerase subunit M/transcription elongation factor TFIIS
MATLAKMKTAASAGGLLQEPVNNAPSAVGQITEVAKAFGLNMPEMAKEQNRLLEQLAQAKAEAQRAEGRADLGKLEAQIDNLKNLTTQGNTNNDPLREMAVEMAKSALQRSQGPGEDDPVASAYKQFIMNKTLSDLELSQSPPTVADQVGSAVETLRAIKELSVAFTPPPPPAPAAIGLSPEKNMELELKKLEIQQQIEMYRIQRQTEADSKKAQGMQEAVKMIGSAIEGIGKNVADQLMNTSPGYAPESMSSPPDVPANLIPDFEMADPAAVEGDDNPLVGKVECPDCGQEAVYITKKMWEAGQTGQSVIAACVACGAQHELGDAPSPAAEVTAPATAAGTPKTKSPSAPPAQVGRNGKERPARRNFVSVD